MFCERITTKLGRFSSDPVYIYIYIYPGSQPPFLKTVVNLLEDDFYLPPQKIRVKLGSQQMDEKNGGNPRTLADFCFQISLGIPNWSLQKRACFEGGGNSVKMFKDCQHTLPETNSLHLKIDGWNTTFLLGRPIFRFYVSFREGSRRCQGLLIAQGFSPAVFSRIAPENNEQNTSVLKVPKGR